MGMYSHLDINKLDFVKKMNIKKKPVKKFKVLKTKIKEFAGKNLLHIVQEKHTTENIMLKRHHKIWFQFLDKVLERKSS